MLKPMKAILLLAPVILLSACRKDLPAPLQSTNPVFSFNGTINGQTMVLTAGVNNYFMFSSFANDSVVTEYIGDLKNINCPGECAGALRITLRNNQQSSVPVPDSGLASGYYLFAIPGGTGPAYDVHFADTMTNGQVVNYFWSFGDGAVSNIHNPTHHYSHPGVYQVTLRTTDTTGHLDSIVNKWPIGPCANAFIAQFRANVSADSAFITDMTTGAAPVTYSWNYGDGLTSAGPPNKHIYSTTGLYKVTATETDASGYTAVFNYHVACTPTRFGALNFVKTSAVTAPNPLNLNNVIVEWTDAGGTHYTSSYSGQPNTSIFQIISVENYKPNASGQATLKIHAKVSCMLSSGTSTIPMTNADVIFAVAHP
ncbi:MAG: PKD domain-containing protein [Bacteroidia bacterium]